jgi:Superinfection immunity protein
MGAAVVVLLMFAYFLPALVACARHHHNSGMIFVLNLFLGWTLLGWVIPLAMAAGEVRPRQLSR